MLTCLTLAAMAPMNNSGEVVSLQVALDKARSRIACAGVEGGGIPNNLKQSCVVARWSVWRHCVEAMWGEPLQEAAVSTSLKLVQDPRVSYACIMNHASQGPPGSNLIIRVLTESVVLRGPRWPWHVSSTDLSGVQTARASQRIWIPVKVFRRIVNGGTKNTASSVGGRSARSAGSVLSVFQTSTLALRLPSFLMCSCSNLVDLEVAWSHWVSCACL